MHYITNDKLLIKLNISPISCEREVQNRTDVAFRIKFPVLIGLHLNHKRFFKLNIAYTIAVLVWFISSLTCFETHVTEIKAKKVRTARCSSS